MNVDDTTLLLNSRRELADAECLLTTFENGSGAKINAEKTGLLPLVLSPQQVADSRFSQRPKSYKARLIGVLQNDADSWDPIVAKISTLKDIWQSQGLSLRCKVLIGKTGIPSQATYLLQAQEIPIKICQRLDRTMALQKFASLELHPSTEAVRSARCDTLATSYLENYVNKTGTTTFLVCKAQRHDETPERNIPQSHRLTHPA